MEHRTISVVGAGLMGCATALEAAKYGCRVLLKDIDERALKEAAGHIKREYRSACLMDSTYGSVPLRDIMDRISVQAGYEGFEQADIVIENVTEDEAVKTKEYGRLGARCREDALYALNTSCISITRLASHLPRPDRAIGVHLMNPVPVKRMVEVIRGHHTSPETEERIVEFLRSMNKNPVVIDDLPGFVSNRLSHLLMNEAAFIVQDGIASAEQVDAIMKHGFKHDMGPLATADLIGLDTVVRSLDVLYRSYQDSKFRCCPLLRKKVDAGETGRKSGKGFYSYA
ncbi:3-hydroxyacyl-CoA dehydrogenase family protein [Saccharibacillus sp. CPCC 101409]|uniref:3-hydroxyacyl-CoA dehydrogenase family protein n=1 Tax=Saccharibacillus sp. CPCC 101409 TaxID=3058041 RepID=UPI002672E52A|nr:3-hydroxyacyl-CoA dehydrogenase family protein [Saccharibacillus sp. CPCC 101409]MDO3410494.1 3-hydroxyacyl-CoA dehydrogenase family protein [Saccharibacillus sp. CPCC 101409]